MTVTKGKSELKILLEKAASPEERLSNDEVARALWLIFESESYHAEEDCSACKQDEKFRGIEFKAIYDKGLCRRHAWSVVQQKYLQPLTFETVEMLWRYFKR